MSRRIVVADDEANIRKLVTLTLKREGYEILEATSGDAALELIKAERPELAVLDVRMPGMTGLEVAKALSEDPETAAIPVVVLSASAQESEMEAGLAAGATAYVTKPFAPAELAARVRSILEP
jgi:CheY-like chemotaxis protein